MRRLLFFVLLLNSMVSAQEMGIEAQLSADAIALGETVQLTIAITRDASQAYQSYQRPELADFEVLQQGQAESTQWIINNGRQVIRTVEQHVYLLRPRHVGTCTIRAAVARIAGREWRTKELSVHVSAAHKRSAALSAPSFLLPETVDPLPQLPDGESVHLEAHADKSTVYVGQQLTVTWALFTRTDVLRYRVVHEPRHDDFWSEDLFSPPGALSWTRQTVHGQDYEVAPLLKKALFPLKAGRLTVSPLEAEVTSLETAFEPGGSVTRRSPAITVEVLPLPSAGQPQGFEAVNVGRLELLAQLDKSEVAAGDAVTYQLTLRGEGNIKNVRLKKVDRIEGFKVYEPTVTHRPQPGDAGGGAKVYSYLLLPQRGGWLTIPAVELPFFDPVEKRYFIARAPSQAVKVNGDPEKIGATLAEAKENLLTARIRPLRNIHHLASRLGEQVIRGPIFLWSLGAPPVLLLALLGGGALRAVLQRETARGRRRRARASARRRMREAEMHLRAQRGPAFFAALARAIYEHLEYRLETRCEALTLDELASLLVQRGFDDETTRALVQELEACDFARFAPAASGPGEMRSAQRRVKELLAAIEATR